MYGYKHMFVTDLVQNESTEEEKIVFIIQKGKIVDLLMFANRRFSWKMDFLVCLLFVNDCFN